MVVVVVAVVAAAVGVLVVVVEILGVCMCGRCVPVSFYHDRYPRKCSKSSQSHFSGFPVWKIAGKHGIFRL